VCVCVLMCDSHANERDAVQLAAFIGFEKAQFRENVMDDLLENHDSNHRILIAFVCTRTLV